MKLLILYATYSGSTQQASQIVKDTLLSKGHEVVLKLTADTKPAELSEYDGIILCTPTWDYDGKEGMPHEDYMTFMEACAGSVWPGKSFAILGLGDSSYSHFCGSVDHLEEFVKKVQGTLIHDSLRIDGFFFDQETNTTRIRDWSEAVHSAFP
jgi:flavodoxin I